MTDPMTPERLAEIEKRANAATEGPWWLAHPGLIYGKDPHHEGYAQAVAKADPSDAEFITHARTDVPALLAEVRRLREEARAFALWVEAQTEAPIRRGLDQTAAGETVSLGSFAQYAEPDPLDEDNHADRYDRDGDRWVWCDECYGLRMDGHGMHEFGYGWSAYWVNENYGPLTFAPRPADTPTTAPQPDEAHGDTPDPARPAERYTDNIRAEARAEGWCTGYADGAQATVSRLNAALADMTRSSAHLLGGSSEKNAAYRMGICDGLTGAARIARGEQP